MKCFFKQLLVAFVFALLNLGVNQGMNIAAPKFPIFMDMIFIYAASFLGLLSGILCSFFYSIFDFIATKQTDNLPYVICMMTGVLITRYCLKNVKVSIWLNLLLVTLLSALIISIEGGIIYTLLFSNDNSVEFTPSVHLTAQLLMSNIPLLASAILARIPINLADKLVAVFLGYGVFFGIKRLENTTGKPENRGEQ